MITYVNTVLVGSGVGTIFSGTDIKNATAGQYVIMNLDGSINKPYLAQADLANADEIKVGLVQANKVQMYDHNTKQLVQVPQIKWSNNIKRSDIKSLVFSKYAADVPESIEIDFTNADMTTVDDGGFCIVLRVTHKDLPTRYRKWTDSYSYVTKQGDTAADVAQGLADDIARNYKRNRFTASVNGSKLVLTAMDYDDDNSVDTINVAGQIRFNANLYYTNPNGVGFTSKNKYSLNGVTITKTPGDMYTASAKLVRDREAQAMGYEGILNRGDGTWPIIKPAMNTDLSKHYDSVTLEFENMYRAADDIFRKTKQTLEIYDVTGTANNIYKALKAFAQVDGNGVAPLAGDTNTTLPS